MPQPSRLRSALLLAIPSLLCATMLGSCFNEAEIVSFVQENSRWVIQWEQTVESVCVTSSDRENAYALRYSGETQVRFKFSRGKPVEMLPIDEGAVTVKKLSFNLHSNCDRDRHPNAEIVDKPEVAGAWSATGGTTGNPAMPEEFRLTMTGSLKPGHLRTRMTGSTTDIIDTVAGRPLVVPLRFRQIEQVATYDTLIVSSDGAVRTRNYGTVKFVALEGDN